MRLTLPIATLVALGTSSSVSAFAVLGPSSSSHHTAALARTSSKTSSRLFMSEPSDTSTDDTSFIYASDGDSDVVDTESSNYTPTAGEAMVSNIMDMMPRQLGADNVSDETRSAINEALYKLEALNPTTSPTVSPLLNGVWELRYVGGYSSDWALPSPTRQLALFLYSGGYSPGTFALALAQKLPSSVVDVGDLEIAISRQQPRVEATVPVKILGGGESKIVVQARLETKSDLRMRETYESAQLVGNNVIELPQPLQYARDLYVTYVDEDLLIVRDASGVPEVLVRKEKTFSKVWGVEPGQADLDGEGPSGVSEF
jgi:hypothetical protein